MNQIFLFLACLGNTALLVTLFLGWRIENAAALTDVARQQVSVHFLFALAASAFTLFVHAVVLTYFMGTGRWIQETSEAYGFAGAAREANMKLKYRALPGMMLCLGLVLVTGAFGAIADPGSNTQMEHSVTIHFSLAISTIVANFLINIVQYTAIVRNSEVVNLVYEEVLRVRRERGLDAPGALPTN